MGFAILSCMVFPRVSFYFIAVFFICLFLTVTARADIGPTNGSDERSSVQKAVTTDSVARPFEERQKQLEAICTDPDRKAAEKNKASNSCQKLNPTVYYTPILKPADRKCPKGSKYSMLNERGTYTCVSSGSNQITNEEGSAVIVDSDGMPTKILKKGSRGMVAEDIPAGNAKACPLGIGGSSHGETVCLNPFRMVATGPGHKKGEVMFVPKTFCMRYPLFPDQPKDQWAYHDGFWIVGDSFGSAQRASRADFFGGPIAPLSNDNPLYKLGLGDQRIAQQFCHVDSSKTASVLKENGFPKELPEHVQAVYRDGSLFNGEDPLQRSASEVSSAQLHVTPAKTVN